MKRTSIVLLVMAAVAALVVWAPTMKHASTALPVVHAQAGCSNATLTGNYGFNNPGFTTPDHSVKGAEVPFASVGVLAFDGAGGISANYTLALRGGISPGQSGTGTYTVNSDCTGSISFPTIVDFNIVVIGGGTEVFGIETTPSFTGTFDAKKQ
jgi:hypothetical protein